MVQKMYLWELSDVVSFFIEEMVKMDILDEQNRCRKTTQRPFWPAARVRRTSVLPQVKTLAQAEFTSIEHFNTEG